MSRRPRSDSRTRFVRLLASKVEHYNLTGRREVVGGPKGASKIGLAVDAEVRTPVHVERVLYR